MTNLAINLVALSSDSGRRTSEIEFSGVRVSTIHRKGTGVVPFLPWAFSIHLYEMRPPQSLHSPIIDNLVPGSIISLQFDLQLRNKQKAIKNYFLTISAYQLNEILNQTPSVKGAGKRDIPG